MHSECLLNIGQPFPSTETSVISSEEILSRWTLSAGDSRVKISVMQEKAQESKVAGQGCGRSLPESFAWYDRDTCLWKTYQRCLTGEWAEYSATFPRAGMMRNGIVCPLRPLAPHISVTGFGYLPTPHASLGEFKAAAKMEVPSCFNLLHNNRTRKSGAKIGSSLRWSPEFIREHLRTGGELNPEWIEVLMGFPATWTMLDDNDLKVVETPSSPKSLNGLDEES